ncbi:MAG: hypothetical protein ABL864_03495 [Terricaulis sp.]|jgi:hypothetical protein
MMKFAVVVLTLALAGCGQGSEKAPAAPPIEQGVDPSGLQIEVGRYGAMLGQVRDLTRERPGAAELDPATPREIARALRETVWEFNVDRSRICAKGLFAEIACGPAYEPVWISEPASAEPTLEDLQIRSTALGEEVMRFWDAVCQDARTRVEDAQEKMYVCAIE